MLPGAKKIELFARNNNLRPGWLSLGNQLGENYVAWKNVISCDGCGQELVAGRRRYKSKVQANFDLCEGCFKQSGSQPEGFYLIENATEDDILHEYHKCNGCSAEPIWGIRFKCSTCEDVDLCELCFDSRLRALNEGKGQVQCHEHAFECVELPLLADGLAAHSAYKCVSCYMKPIIGACFLCADCPHFSLCQNCYFTTPYHLLKVRGHAPEHRIEVAVEPREATKRAVKCNGCGEYPI